MTTDSFDLQSHMILTGFSPRHASETVITLNTFKARLGFETLAQTLAKSTKQDVESFLTGLMAEESPRTGKPRSPNSLHKYLSQLRTAFKQAVELSMREANPTDDVKGPRQVKSFVNPPRKWEIEGLLSAAMSNRNTLTGLRDFALIMLIATTGARASEVLGHSRSKVLSTRQLLINGKGGRQRSNVVPQPAVDAIKKYSVARDDRSDHLFLNTSGGPLTLAAVRFIFDRLNKRAGIAGVTAHDLRRWFFNRCVQAGVDWPTLQSIGGWSTSRAAWQYLKVGASIRAEKVHRDLDFGLSV